MSTPSECIPALYQRHAAAWVEARLRERFHERGSLDRFRAHIPPGGSILDLGCGAGAPIAQYFDSLGYAVTGVDSSPAMVAMFQARLPRQQAFLADMRTLSLDRSFQGILAWDSFFHLNHGDQQRMFSIFRAHAAPNAVLMFTSGPAHGEAMGCLEGEPLYHASLDPGEYRALLDGAGFAVAARLEEDPSGGARTGWLAQLR